MEKAISFLTGIQPPLTESDEYGYTPLHYAATGANSILGYQSDFEYGIRYHPNKKGNSLLFKEKNIYLSRFIVFDVETT